MKTSTHIGALRLRYNSLPLGESKSKSMSKSTNRLLLSIVLLAGLLSSMLCAAAQTNVPVSLAWDPSPSTGVTNYALYASQNPSFTNNLAGTGVTRVNVGTSLTATAQVAMGTRWYFCTTAWAGGLESTNPPSNVVSYIAPTLPASPGNMRLTFVFPPGTAVTSTATNITITFP